MVQAISESDEPQCVHPTAKQYLVWSNEHRAWWRPNSNGYTGSIDQAGRYTRHEAVRIVDGANAFIPTDHERFEVMVLAPECIPTSGDRTASSPDQRELET